MAGLQRLLSLISSATICAVALAQTTHAVGTGGYPNVNAALAVAAPGDVILVQPGNYPAFASTIGVTVRAASGVVVFSGLTADVPAGQTLHLTGIVVNRTTITGGNATLDGCITYGCAVTASEASFQSCIAWGLPSSYSSTVNIPALAADSATITAIDSVFYGAGSNPEFFGNEAIRLTNSAIYGSHLTIAGGSGYAAYTAIRCLGSSGVWISDSTVEGGSGVIPSLHVCAMTGTASTAGRLVRCTLVPNTPSCLPIPVVGSMLGMHRPTPLQSPGPFSLEFTTDPNGLVAVYFATDLGNLAVAGLEQPILLDVATTFHLELLTANAVGVASGTWNVPAGLTNQTFFFQAVGTAPAPSLLQLSPLAGGVVN